MFTRLFLLGGLLKTLLTITLINLKAQQNISDELLFLKPPESVT
jgi:hypothetical protein